MSVVLDRARLYDALPVFVFSMFRGGFSCFSLSVSVLNSIRLVSIEVSWLMILVLFVVRGMLLTLVWNLEIVVWLLIILLIYCEFSYCYYYCLLGPPVLFPLTLIRWSRPAY